MDNSNKNYVFALYFVTLTDVYVKTVSDNSISIPFIYRSVNAVSRHFKYIYYAHLIQLGLIGMGKMRASASC